MSILGIDEVGRGCLAGPVVAGAVLLPAVVDFERDPWLKEIKDSKLLKPEVRERLAPLITQWALASAIGVASVEEIDSINIFHASHLAMLRAAEETLAAVTQNTQFKPLSAEKIQATTYALVDGKFLPKNFPCRAQAVIKGDLKCLSIAAASIIAKVWRDRHMADLDAQYPGYGFSIHKGYSTPAHSSALKARGACPIHRRSFAPVAARIQLDLF